MRIRSNLTSGSLYSDSRSTGEAARGATADGAKPARRYPGRISRAPRQNSAGRRIFRLGLMLVLVLLVMQRAADPEIYRRIFGALGAPLEGPAVVIPAEEDGAETNRAETNGASAALGAPLTATVAALDDDQVTQLSALLAARRHPDRTQTETAARPEEPSQALLQALGDAAMASGEVDSDALLAALQASAEADPQGLRGRLQAALDARYWTTVSDASVWRPGDANAFYRLLEKGRSFAEPPIRVGYAPLAVQPQAYRGRPVSLEGYAARIEPHRAADNPFGVERYWLVWVRPSDGSERPVMLYTSRLPDSLERLTADETLLDGPRIVAAGTFLKRHLYPSQRGSELAPVIVGGIEEIETGGWGLAAAGEQAEAHPVGAPGAGGQAGRPQPPRWWLAGLIAAVTVPIAFTLWIGWRSSREEKRQREIRARGMPTTAPFLDALEDRSPKGDAIR